MFSTLHRYIFRELIRIFLPATAALTVVLSLSSLLDPIQEYGIGPSQVVDLLLCFIPIMLTFVLPIAALFGASLTYGRLAADNEIDAFKASGVSPLSLTYPVFVLAMLVAMANLVMSFHVMPLFVHHSEKSIKADAKQILFRNLQRQGYYRLGSNSRSSVYADYVDPKKDILAGVVVVQYREGKVDNIRAVDVAHVTFDSNDQFSYVRITAKNPILMGSGDATWAHMNILDIDQRVGSFLKDDINFKRISEMKEIQAHPLNFYPIEQRARDTCIQFFTELLYQDIQRQFHASNAGYRLTGSKHRVVFTAGECLMGTDHSIVLTDGVSVDIQRDADLGGPMSLRCEKVVLHLEGDEFSPHLTMDISNANNLKDGRVIMWHIIQDLHLPANIQSKVNNASVLASLSEAAMNAALPLGISDHLHELQQVLVHEIQVTQAQIEAEIHARLVFGIGCIPMILIGAALGILKRGGHLLSAFGISFIPAVILLVTIISGRHLQNNLGSSQAVSGLGVMWTGLGILFLMVLGLYRRLLRH